MSFPRYPEYKDSGVEWLRRIPSSWGHGAIRWLCRRYSGGTPDKTNIGFWEDGLIPWINSGAVNERLISAPSAYITEAALAESSAKWVPAGALVMALAGQGKTKGTVAQVAFSTTCNQSTAAIVPGAAVVPRFLLWWLDANYQNIRNLAGGDLRDGLNLELLGDIQCPLPPIAEQTAIAAFLDRETAKFDALVAVQEQLIELLNEKRQAVISHVVTKGLNPAAPMKDSAIEWLGEIPEHWQVRRLKDISPRISGRLVYQPAQYFVADGVPFLMGNNITERGISWNDVKFVPPEVNARFAHHALREGDVVTVRVGAPGVTCVVPPDADGLNCGSLMIIRRDSAFDSRWLAAVMNSHLVRAQIDRVQYGAAQEQINIRDAVNFFIPTPPTYEQKLVSSFIERETSRFDALLEDAQDAIDLLQERRSALISAAVTGQIDVRGVAAQSAA
jgi:type I restriction enzyme, S subunit